MLLRCVRDLEYHRNRSAAVTIHAAQELLLAELGGRSWRQRCRGSSPSSSSTRDAVRELAARAVLDQLSGRDAELLREYADDAGALIDAWRYVPLGFA